MLSKPPTPPVPWHWKQLDARRRPLVLAGWVIALVVLPSLRVTFLFGPAGLLLYLAARAALPARESTQ